MLRLATLALTALLVAAPAASASPGKKKPKGGSAVRCEARTFTKVFKPWHDRGLYTLAPGGNFETSAAGWKLAGGAAVAADSSPFLLAGSALGAGSLELPAGASAVSPPICVERGFRSFRFLARSVLPVEDPAFEEEIPLDEEFFLEGDEEPVDEEFVDEPEDPYVDEEEPVEDELVYELGELKVQVIFTSSGKKTKNAGRFEPGEAWAPARKVSFAQGRFKARKRGSATVRLKFLATAGVVRVDDVYVDPRFRY